MGQLTKFSTENNDLEQFWKHNTIFINVPILWVHFKKDSVKS